MAFKFLPPESFYEFKRAYEKISLSTEDGKTELLYTLYNKIEADLTYAGCSAIEDKLQDVIILNIIIILLFIFINLNNLFRT